MKIYYSDREGNLAPADSSFHIYPFNLSSKSSPTHQLTTLPSPASAKIVNMTFLPTLAQWRKNVAEALDCIRKGLLQKVVLARSCTLELNCAPDPFAIASALKQRAENAFVYCCSDGHSSFLGASPERLFVRNGRNILTEAVAGTRPRQSDEQELLNSDKDIREFSYIPLHLQSRLSPLCTSPITFTPLSVLKTQNVQHLYAQGRGILQPFITDEQIIQELAPTPALCGSPQEPARKLIEKLEPLSRGLYGGVLGWSTPEKGEYIVAIRSCFLQGNVATIYSGTGIVEGSSADEEWEELNQKLKIYETILDH